MKVFKVFNLDGRWYLASPSAIEQHDWQRLVLADDDKEVLLRLALVLARKWQGAVEVFDVSGHVAERFCYGFEPVLTVH